MYLTALNSVARAIVGLVRVRRMVRMKDKSLRNPYQTRRSKRMWTKQKSLCLRL